MDRIAYTRKTKLLLTLVAVSSIVLASRAADRSWSGTTGSYNNPAAWGGTVPGTNDAAINDNGTNNQVQINNGDPDWSVNQIRAGSATGNGAFQQNGQTLNLLSQIRGLRLGVGAGRTGVYTMNGGTLNYTNGLASIGEFGNGIMNVNGGSITGTGNFAVNLGTSDSQVSGTMDGGANPTGYTWFEQGFYTADSTRGLPTAGSTFVSAAQADHSFKMAPSYMANNAFVVDSNLTSVTVTFSSPSAYSGLSFLGSSGNGATTVSYTVHHADATTETGTLSVPDWFGSGTVAYKAGGRCRADGSDTQIIGSGSPDFPYLFSLDVGLSNTGSAVTSVDLAISSGTGHAAVMAVSGSTGADYTPITVSGYNLDIVIEAGAVTYITSNTSTLNQTAGTISIGGEMWVGNYGTGVYNFSGGTNTVNSYIGIGRSGGNGTVNMTGGVWNKTGGGNLLVASGYNVPAGGSAVGVLNQSGGTINVQSGEFLCPENSPSTGTYNLSGTGALNVNSWLAVGRNGAVGTLNMTGGTIQKTGNSGNHIVLGAGGAGTINQTNGTIISTNSDTWLGENAAGVWNMYGGSTILSSLHICQGGGANGTMNLYGGTLTVNEITTGNAIGVSVLNLAGGTIVAAANNPTFLHDIIQTTIGAGGITFDSQNFDIIIDEPLQDGGGGGLTKTGSGTLTLTAANSYSGPTVVNAGTLILTTDSVGGGSYSVNDGAALSLIVKSGNAQLNAADVTLGASTGATLGIDLGAFGNPILAPINASGTLNANGVTTINITDGMPQFGQFPLIQYAARTGSGSFVLGSMPVGVVASIVTNTSSIDINITTVNTPRWDGQAGGTWDIGVTTNWINTGTGLPVTYGEGNAVTFDDNALGTTTVNLTTTVNPGSVTANNSGLNYTLTGSGKIGGATGFTKSGTGTFTIANATANTFTGPTVIANGVLNVTNLANGGSPSAIGASSASPSNLVIGGGQLAYAGPAVAINRGYTVQGGNGGITTVGNLTLSGLVTAPSTNGFTKAGPAKLAYTTAGANQLSGVGSAGYLVQDGSVVFDGTAGAQTNTISGSRLGVAGVGTSPLVVLTNAALTVNGNVDLGNLPSSTGSLTVNSGSLNIGSWFILGDGPDGVGTFTLNGGNVTQTTGNLLMGGNIGTMSTLNINGGSLTKSGGTVIVAPGNWNGDGVRTGIVNQVGGTFDSAVEIQLGQGNFGTAFYNMSGGTLFARGWMVTGRAGGNGTFNMTGGTIVKTNGGNFIIGSGAGNNTLSSVGVFNQSGGTINDANEYWVAENKGTMGTNNISGTAAINVNNWVSLGRGGVGIVNMSGGTFNKTGGGQFIIGEGAGYCEWNQTGGALNIASELWIGQAGGTTGRFSLVTGTVTNNSWLAIGREGANGTLNISGGSMTKNGGGNISIAHGGGAAGTVNLSGGVFTVTSGQTWIGEDNGPGIWNQTGGTANMLVVHLAQTGSATGTLNLDGGTFSAQEVTTGSSGTSTLNLNGGTLAAANGATLEFLHGLTTATVKSGGAIIDSGSNTINVAQALLDGTGGGGLTKLGNGTLRLNGVNTYTGTTLVNAGALGGTGTIAGPVSVASGATLAPGASIGTLTINNTLTLNGGSSTLVEISLDGGTTNSDLVTGLTSVNYAGSLVVTNIGTNSLVAGNVFKLFNAAASGGNFGSVTILPFGSGTFNPSTGELTITSAGPPTINPPKFSSGNLILTGTGTPGASYTVLTATNVASPVAQWTTNATGAFDGSGTFSNAIPVSTSEPTRFFRLRTP